MVISLEIIPALVLLLLVVGFFLFLFGFFWGKNVGARHALELEMTWGNERRKREAQRTREIIQRARAQLKGLSNLRALR